MKIILLREKRKNWWNWSYRPILVLWITGFLLMSLPVGAVSKENSLENEKISLTEALYRISVEYQVFFSYDQEAVQDVVVFYEPDRYENVEHALDRMLIGTSLHYRMFNNRYIILYESHPEAINSLKDMVQHLESVIDKEEKGPRRSPAPSLPPLPARTKGFFVAPIAFSVSGTVTDQDGEPLIGVNIQVKGSNKGTSTDFDGNFTLEDVDENAVLVISYIGYQTQEVPIAGKSNLEVIMISDSQLLDEVVVVGYGTANKFELTSAVSHISNDKFLNIVSNNPMMQIQGKVPGVAISNTSAADPNSDPSIQVRGVSSRSAGLGPLIVIDGVPGGNLRNINENDIESISVLKGGAASAIYGTRGSNGVILVTTKRVNTDLGSRISYSGNMSWGIAKNELPVLTAKEFRKHLPERGDDFGSDTDWFKEITRTSFNTKHTVQISGGTSNNNYMGTIDYQGANGIDLRSGRKEVGARLTFNHKNDNDLYRLNLNIAPRKIQNKNYGYYSSQGAFSQALSLNPTMPIYESEEEGIFYEPTTWEAENPVEKLKTELDEGEIKYLDWNGTFNLNLIPILGLSNDKVLNTQITIAQQINDNNSYWFRPSTSTLARKNGYNGEASRGVAESVQQSLEWLINYDFQILDHGLKIMGGYSYQNFTYSGLNVSNKNFTSDQLTYNAIHDGTYMSESEGRLGMDSYKNGSKLIAFFSRVSYDYRSKYLFSASMRYEGSSKFGTNSKWGYFPGISAGWRLSEENFLKDINWVSELKLRADYGVTGNQDFGSYNSLATMAGFGQVYYNGKYYQGWARNRNLNPDLSWELGQNFNIGIDFSILNNKVYGDINYYNRTQKDLLGNYNVPIPPNIESSTFVNVGTMKNSGIEASLNWNIISNEKFGVTTEAVIYTTNNRFVSFSNDLYEGQNFYWLDGYPAPGSPGPVQQIRLGERIGSFYTYKYVGIDESGDWLVESKSGEPISIGEATDSDKKVVGNGLPKYTLSWNNILSFNSFDLSAFFRGNFGYQVYNTHEFYWGLQSAAGNLNVLNIAYEKNAEITKGGNAHNSYFVQDANHLKLDVLTLGYNTKPDVLNVSNIRFFITGRNLFTLTKFMGVDLDVFQVNGLEPGVPDYKKSYYPSVRQFMIGFNVEF